MPDSSPAATPATTNVLPNALPDAILLAATGGLLDAAVYLLHGHVFANAMTGNVIFLGIAAVGRDWHEIAPHLSPLAGFVLGVWASVHLRTRLGPRAATTALAFEIVALLLLALLPLSFPQMIFTVILAFVSAFQVATFRRVERFAFNSTFLTGNLRDFVEGAYQTRDGSASSEDRAKGRAQAINLGLICLAFLLGAVVGAWSAPRLGNHTLWLAVPPLAAVMLRTL